MRKIYLNICSGKLQKKSTSEIRWINIDKADVDTNAPDIEFLRYDIRKGFPFKDEEIDHIEAIACLGQIVGNDEFLFVMNELWRVLKKDGTIHVYLPHKDFPHAYIDAFNQRHFNEESWYAFDENHPQYINHHSYYGFRPFKNVDVVTNDSGFLDIHMTVSK